MTVRRTYQCDLCPATIRDNREGIGILWLDGSSIQARCISQVEHHLCAQCVKALKKMFDVLPAEVAYILDQDADVGPAYHSENYLDLHGRLKP